MLIEPLVFCNKIMPADSRKTAVASARFGGGRADSAAKNFLSSFLVVMIRRQA
jgi:hypothetical protein